MTDYEIRDYRSRLQRAISDSTTWTDAQLQTMSTRLEAVVAEWTKRLVCRNLPYLNTLSTAELGTLRNQVATGLQAIPADSVPAREAAQARLKAIDIALETPDAARNLETEQTVSVLIMDPETTQTSDDDDTDGETDED